ncbi:MAG: tRNA pseudouridine(55) synthase TruB [Actinomycetota bacterium]|nr:tRNA pseudouridine(55) synthase TruB [Actinomycetota bacterium]
MTSHDVVSRCRRIFGQRRVGHGGTLDPGATGVLVVALGQATRLLRFLSELPKSYEGEIVLGVETTTLDDEGEITATHDMSAVTLDEVRAATVSLTGHIDQVPPMVSAVKVGGRRLHELARAGIEVERAPRPVVVHRFDIEHGDQIGVIRIAVDCSSGTYVRVLAADLGAALGGGAHLRKLRRTAVGPFSLNEARPLDDHLSVTDVLPPTDAVCHLDQVTVSPEARSAVTHGAALDRATAALTGAGPWAVLDGSGALLAVYEAKDDTSAKPAVVLSGQ